MRRMSTKPLTVMLIRNALQFNIKAIIAEQAEIKKVVEDLASRLDRSQKTSGVAQNELSTNALLEINALKSKVQSPD